MLKNKSKILIFSLSILLIPCAAHGASLVMDCYATGDCGFCDALKLVTQIANYIIGLSGVAALLMFLYAGLTLITSKGNSNKISSATKIMINAVIGMFVIYIAWAGVNYLIYTLTDGQQTGKGVSTVFKQSWQTFTCEKKTVGDIVWRDVEQPGSTAKLKEISDANLPNSCKTDTVLSGNAVLFRTAKSSVDVSTELHKVLQCMYDLLTERQIGGNILTYEDIYITSISDDRGIAACVGDNYVACSSTVTTNCCYHARNSCHYGGANPATPAKSYAVDIRSNDRTDDENALIEQLIIKAGGRYYDETDTGQPHHHMSVSPCSSAY